MICDRFWTGTLLAVLSDNNIGHDDSFMLARIRTLFSYMGEHRLLIGEDETFEVCRAELVRQFPNLACIHIPSWQELVRLEEPGDHNTYQSMDFIGNWLVESVVEVLGLSFEVERLPASTIDFLNLKNPSSKYDLKQLGYL